MFMDRQDSIHVSDLGMFLIEPYLVLLLFVVSKGRDRNRWWPSSSIKNNGKGLSTLCGAGCVFT